MHLCRVGNHVEVLTPAKINLFLEVLGKRQDGFHELETCLVAVTLYDSLTFTPVEDGSIEIDSRWAWGVAAKDNDGRRAAGEPLCSEIPPREGNLAWKAAVLLRERSGIRRGARIWLVKRIPAAAGLGGASSDAAATLVAANLAWRLDWSRERLAELAAELGSDVPFFLTRGAALACGRGERIASLPVPRLHLVVVRPPVGLATAPVYQACRPAGAPRGTKALLQALACGDAVQIGRAMTNTLEAPATSLTPWIERVRGELERQNFVGNQMSGSGSSCFGLSRTAASARRAAARLRARNLGAVFAVTTAVAS